MLRRLAPLALLVGLGFWGTAAAEAETDGPPTAEANTQAAGALAPPTRADLPQTGGDPPQNHAEAAVDFAHQVLPLLRDRCAACHTAGRYEGEISFDTREEMIESGAVVPGKSAESPLIERVAAPIAAMRMPPTGAALTAEEVALLRRWIDGGADWTEGFSFKAATEPDLAPRRPPLPPAQGDAAHPVDRLLAAYYQRQGIAPPRPADDRTFARRAYLDLVGLLPPPEELETFTADADPRKRERLIDALLARDRDYAEHWLSFWNDLLRNDYAGPGYIDGGRRQITPWLYRALLENKPYDVLVRELVAPTPESEGFMRGIRWRGDVNSSQTPEMQFSQNVAQVFLGVNLKCASCHDSFIDHWRLEDAYGLAAVMSERPLQMHRCDVPTGAFARPKFLYPQLGEIDADRPAAERLRQLAALVTHPENGRLTRTIVNRLWHRLLGRGLVHPVDAMSGPAWDADLLDWLAADLADHGYDLKHALRRIATSRAYQAEAMLQDEETIERYVFRGPLVRRMTAEQWLDAVWRITGAAPERPAVDLGDRGGLPVRASLVAADPLMTTLGRPNREQVVTTRPEQLTTLQALDLSNGEQLARLVDRGAVRLTAEFSGGQTDPLIDAVFLRTLGRLPAAAERHIAAEMVGRPATREGAADLLWSVLMLPEFQLIR